MLLSRHPPPNPFSLQAVTVAVVGVLAMACVSAREKDLFAPQIDYKSQIAPILSAHCFECHGRAKQEGGLRLDRNDRALAGGDNGRVIIPNDAAISELVRRVTSADLEKRMPSEAGPLAAAEINLLTQWINEGATGLPANLGEGPQHWAFQPIQRPAVPDVMNVHSSGNPIDHFVFGQLELRGVAPSPTAPATTLIRRLSLDLLGVPPEWERVQQFIQNKQPDAWERLIDEFLDSPHYGERWGRHWLDLARYADSSGYEADTPREIWPYRDWVIDALNRNMQFDQFVTEQIAGDLLPNPTAEQYIATGFHCNAMLDPGVRWESIVDRVNTTGTVFLGLTLGCAQCHSHKTDPVSQREYYQLYAFFNEASITPFEGPVVNGKEGRPQQSLVMKQSPQPTHIFQRGDPAQPGDLVQPNLPSAFDWNQTDSPADHQTRLDLAHWLVSSSNPLTARVTVNRIWQRYFGLGLVDTENDFGVQTAPPSHSALLDWLANDFRSNGWSLKRLHRLIVMSETYRQSSRVHPNLAERDPRNRWLARQRRMRLESEIIRDVALSVSGLLNRKIGGPSVFPPQPDGILDNRATPATWTVSEGGDRYRRGMYTWIWRLTPHPHSNLFNGPDNVTACTRRDRSNVPVQALTLLNDPTFLECAQRLGRICMRTGHQDDASTIEFLFTRCLSRIPTDNERLILLRLLNDQRAELSESDARDITSRDEGDVIDEAAWVVVCRTIMNTDEFITRE